MSTGWTIFVVALACVIFVGLAIALVVFARRSSEEGELIAIMKRIDREGHCEVGWEPPRWKRPSDAALISNDDASYLLQAHYECDADVCEWKGAAFRSKVAARKIEPSTRSERYAR
jgi:hypothetical protein